MRNFIAKFKLLFQESLLLKAIVFLIGASAMVFALYGWSLFHSNVFDVKYDTYQFVSNTGGTRASLPTFYISDSQNNKIGVTNAAKNCFSHFDLSKEFELGYVQLNRQKIAVACSQGSLILNVSDGLYSVHARLDRYRVWAKSSLLIFLVSIIGTLLFLNKKH